MNVKARVRTTLFAIRVIFTIFIIYSKALRDRLYEPSMRISSLDAQDFTQEGFRYIRAHIGIPQSGVISELFLILVEN